MEEIEVENRKDIRIEGKTVHAMAIHQGMGKLVVTRKNEESSSGDVIEQYNVLCGWISVYEKIICPNNGGIESVSFVGDRILCTHLNGSITLADPHSDFMRRVQICPSPLWSSCAIDSTHAALVSHSAALYVFSLEESAAISNLTLGVDQRLFSVCSRKDVIAVGAMDSVYVVKNNTVAHKLVVPRKEKRLPTIVWSCCFFNDVILACGDSRGVVSFWNSQNGALLANVESHQSEILCLVLCEGRIHAAGVDPRIISIKHIAGNDFRIVQQRNGPMRDVRAMACFDDKVYAAGEDHEIYVAKSGCQVLATQWNKLLCLGGSLAMCRGQNFVDIWTSGAGEQTTSSGEVIVARQPVYLARVYCPEKLPLVACDLSADGRLLAISSTDSTTVYQLNVKNGEKASLRARCSNRPASALKIVGNCLYMTIGDFELWRVSTKDGETVRVLEQNGCGGVTQLAVSPCGRFVAVLTTRLQVFVIDVKTKESLLLRVSLPIDVTFTDGDSLFVLCATPGFSEPSANAKVLFEFPKSGGAERRSASMVDLFGATGYRAVSISAGPNDQLLVVASDGQWVLIDKTRSSVYGPVGAQTAPNGRLNATVPKALHFRSQNRVCSCRLQASEPSTAPFKLKKFGQQ
uniref:WD_REPEATS_REGION domain-containing protein n=1 Tax=Haemonchus contortus TaxID=6289 RepID=A0A7I5E6E0_HAECO